MLTLSPASSEAKADGDPIVIGLVNNMPDSALRTTERQFQNLLSDAGDDRAIRLRYFSLPELPRGEAARSHINAHYEDLSALWASRIDGLIVTGTEPRASVLTDEPYWTTLTKLIDWAEERTISTIWSCLAAHAAVLHMDGIERRRLAKKLSGVFDCEKVADHRITAGASAQWSVPHSRYNDLPEEMLVAQGYGVLSRSAETGADLFVKDGDSLFVFIQGHPEYEQGTLLHEYRRDVGRYLAGERDSYPEMPCGYFDTHAVAALDSFREQALHNRDAILLSRFPTIILEGRPSYRWREPAVRLYRNWIRVIEERKTSDISRY
jgi:homoserine O-succinyltransferase/O-acetyltransferase